MTVDDAARYLAKQILAPRGAVSVSAWYKHQPPEILVWYDAPYAFTVANLPKTFEGYKVVVEPRRQFFAN